LSKYSTLYPWVQAMNDGKDSLSYNNIFDYFTNKQVTWTKDQFDQFVGSKSVLYSMNITFSYNVNKELGTIDI
jgi:hypothetical protein